MHRQLKSCLSQKSPWYERSIMISLIVGGASMAVFMPVQFIATPEEVFGDAKSMAFGLTGIMTMLGLAAMGIGFLGAIQAFRQKCERMLISHLEAAAVIFIITCITIPFALSFREQTEIARKLDSERRQVMTSLEKSADDELSRLTNARLENASDKQ